jgi:hypothetical protein
VSKDNVIQFPSAPTFLSGGVRKNLKIVILESPFESWSQAGVPDLFKNTVELKRLGYDGYYQDGFLPVDSSDFVGTHHLICEENESGLIPVAGFRSVTLGACKKYHLKFPAQSLLDKKDVGTELHCESVKKIIDEAEAANQTLSFGSSWTMLPRVRSIPENASLLKDIARGMLYSYQTENGIDAEMCVGVSMVKTDVYFSELGYDPITLNGRTLAPFDAAYIGYKQVILLHRTEFTPKAIQAAERYRRLWENRIHIQDIPSIKKIAS